MRNYAVVLYVGTWRNEVIILSPPCGNQLAYASGFETNLFTSWFVCQRHDFYSVYAKASPTKPASPYNIFMLGMKTATVCICA